MNQDVVRVCNACGGEDVPQIQVPGVSRHVPAGGATLQRALRGGAGAHIVDAAQHVVSVPQFRASQYSAAQVYPPNSAAAAGPAPTSHR